jgi:hypothetical protein
MRIAALIAGAVQVLFAIFAVSPQIFGEEFFESPGQLGSRAFTFISCLVLAAFLFGIAKRPGPDIGRLEGVLSVLAATAIAVENFRSAAGSFKWVAIEASYGSPWRFHPFRNFAYLLGTLIPALAEITVASFFVFIFVRTLKARRVNDEDRSRTGFLMYASLAVAAVFAIALIGTVIALNSTPRPWPASNMRILMRFSTLASSIAFFLVFSLRKRSSGFCGERSANPSMQ